jgi:hypothetical protein
LTVALIQLKAVAECAVRLMFHANCWKEFRSERGTSMFLIAYVALVLLAALPLARTLLTRRGGRSGVIFLHRLYRDLAYIAAAVVAIIGFEMALTISLQNYWFSELGQRYRYWLALGIRTGIFLTLLVSVGAFVGFNPGGVSTIAGSAA